MHRSAYHCLLLAQRTASTLWAESRRSATQPLCSMFATGPVSIHHIHGIHSSACRASQCGPPSSSRCDTSFLLSKGQKEHSPSHAPGISKQPEQHPATQSPAAQHHLVDTCSDPQHHHHTGHNHWQTSSQLQNHHRQPQPVQSPACLLDAQGHKLRVAVALSGGVDSAVSALLLKQRGHDVFCIFMRNWDVQEEDRDVMETERGGDCHERDLRDAQAVARQLGVPLHEVDFVRQYWDKVFTPFLRGYAAGGTPNPDLACNRHIKFGCLWEAARALGAQAVATGHYARLRPCADSQSVQLLRGAGAQDQSYFLAQVDSGTLHYYLFPVGHLDKVQVRALAHHHGLVSADKRSSRGICFIGPRSFDSFMAQYVTPVPGMFVSVDAPPSAQPLTACDDILPWTVGQRVHLPGQQQRLYVVGKDMEAKVVYAAAGRDHPALYVKEALVGPITWLRDPIDGLMQTVGCSDATRQHVFSHTSVEGREGWRIRCQYKVAYRQTELGWCTMNAPATGFTPSRYHRLFTPGCDITADGSGHGHSSIVEKMEMGDIMGAAGSSVVVFDELVWGVAPHQALVLYSGDVVLGSAILLLPGELLH